MTQNGCYSLSGHTYRARRSVPLPYSIARFGQRLMQAMQCVQFPPQTGLPSRSVMLFSGQTFSQSPQPTHFSVARNYFAETVLKNARFITLLFALSTAVMCSESNGAPSRIFSAAASVFSSPARRSGCTLSAGVTSYMTT